jgi:hypothetical protein
MFLDADSPFGGVQKIGILFFLAKKNQPNNPIKELRA